MQEVCHGVGVGAVLCIDGPLHLLFAVGILPLPCSEPGVPSYSLIPRLTSWLFVCPALGLPWYQALPVWASQDSGPDWLPPSLYRPRLSPEFVLTFTLLRQSPPPLLCDFHISETSSPSSLSLWLTEDCLPACRPSFLFEQCFGKERRYMSEMDLPVFTRSLV